MIERLLQILTYPLPFRRALTKKIVKRLSLLPYEVRLSMGAVVRPHYGYCIFQAARLAKSLGYRRISIIEFGCGGGKGLLAAEMHIAEVSRKFPVDIELYGFDMGSGLPCPRDHRDMPHFFRPGLYHMDRESLDRKLERATLIIGDVKDRCATFFQDYSPAPIGCIFHDLDFYSSTRDSLEILNAEPDYFLPRVFMYFDDVIGDDVWLCNEFAGERLAIEEFNLNHDLKKISQNKYLPLRYPSNEWWPHQVYIYHDFGHPRYNDFVATEEQMMLEKAIRLKQ
jgi:hypothetical protein